MNKSKFVEQLESNIKHADEELKKFQVKFKESPVYALNWADSVFEAAIVSFLGKKVLSWKLKEVSEEKLKEEIYRFLSSKASSLENRSTSPSANLINDKEVVFWSGLIESLKYYPHTGGNQ